MAIEGRVWKARNEEKRRELILLLRELGGRATFTQLWNQLEGWSKTTFNLYLKTLVEEGHVSRAGREYVLRKSDYVNRILEASARSSAEPRRYELDLDVDEGELPKQMVNSLLHRLVQTLDAYLLIGENERKLDHRDPKLRELNELGSSHLSWLVQYVIDLCDLLRERARAGIIDLEKFRKASEAYLK